MCVEKRQCWHFKGDYHNDTKRVDGGGTEGRCVPGEMSFLPRLRLWLLKPRALRQARGTTRAQVVLQPEEPSPGHPAQEDADARGVCDNGRRGRQGPGTCSASLRQAWLLDLASQTSTSIFPPPRGGPLMLAALLFSNTPSSPLRPLAYKTQRAVFPPVLALPVNT